MVPEGYYALMSDDILYLDHAATTPLRPGIRAAMDPFLDDRFGNPSSTHSAGRSARAALEDARERVAAVLSAAPDEIVFTAGGTEADNMAVLGRWRAGGAGVAVSAVEHSAVRESAAQAAREGAATCTIAVDEDGRLDLAALEEALEEPLSVASVMWGNNEVGTLQPVQRAAELCRGRGVSFHTDAVQAVGHVPVSLSEVDADLLSLSAHKFGGPRGVGALFVRRGVALSPLLFGGGQERGLRPGTSNVASAVGLAVALEEAVAELDRESERLRGLRDRLEHGILSRAPGAVINGGGTARLPHVTSLGIPDVSADVLLATLDLAGIAASAGSACHSGSAAPSHVLVAMGRAPDAVVRLSLGWTTTEADVERAMDTIAEVLDRVRPVAETA